MRSFRLALLLLPLSASPAFPFCGFYVGKADSRLFNGASQVALARDGDRTVLTMANDYQGDLSEFAVVIPVPTFIRRDQIQVVDRGVLDHLDAWSAPRLVEYFDEDPCRRHDWVEEGLYLRSMAAPSASKGERSLGVTVEARYAVGEYEILILSATESQGLETWLRREGYRIPEGASSVLGSYLKQQMRFFVARVNLGEQSRLGFSSLRPLRVSYESPKFMLPIRLGTVNARGPQDLVIYALTSKGRVETTNYRTVRLPTGMDLPVRVKDQFASFYKAMFAEQVRREDMRSVFLEYAWDSGSCDPCAADPLGTAELSQLGVSSGMPFVTRLHVRYDARHFPEDLVFQETGDRESFQGRYVLRHPWTGSTGCSAGREYEAQLGQRRALEARALAALTGWDMAEVQRRFGVKVTAAPAGPKDFADWLFSR